MKTILPERYLKQWQMERLVKESLQEIRLRAGQPLMIIYDGIEQEFPGFEVDKRDVEQIFGWLCGYGVYAYQDEMVKGYITVKGGHRVGIGGQTVCDMQGNVTQIKYVSSLLIRVGHEIRGVAKPLLKQLYRNGIVLSTLILAPPGCGKTTLLRDLVREVSDGNTFGIGQNVSLIDEREEIAHMYMGAPLLDVGKRTDVISGCEKAVGMEMCLRALAPQVVAVDEIYSEKDVEAVKRLKGCGCAILATHHAYTFEEFQEKNFGREVLEQKIFSRFILLEKTEGKFQVKEILKDEASKAGIEKS